MSERTGTFAPHAMAKIVWRYQLRHSWQNLLMLVGIALGVAVAVAVDLANASASQAFDDSTDAIAGRATHQIVGGPTGLDESIYTELRRKGMFSYGISAAPAVTAYAYSSQLGGRPLQLLGLDPFVEGPFRDYLWEDGTAPLAELTQLLTRAGSILIPSDVAEFYGVTPGAQITLEIDGYERIANVVGLLAPADDFSRRAVDGLVVADIATAQELTGRTGRLDRIDLILPSDARVAVDQIRALLPAGVTVVQVSARSGTIEEMTAAFRLNLQALSLLALVVGLFLIYNTVTFSVVQRRALFGTLRALGVTRREIFFLVTGEAFIVGALGALIGMGLGVVMGRGAVRAVTQTISDLYFVVSVQRFALPVSSLLKGLMLGVLATVLVAVPPAWEAASVPVRGALSRSGLEEKARRAVARVAAGAIVFGGMGIGLLALPSDSLVLSFLGTLFMVVGCAALTPLVTTLIMRAASRLLAPLWRPLGRMAPRNVVSSISRTAVAVAALMIALSVTIGVSLMISSFRTTVTVWLDQVLLGDVYVSAPSTTATRSTTPIDSDVLPIVEAWQGVERVDLLRTTTVESLEGPVSVFAVRNKDFAERPFLALDIPRASIWEAMQKGAVVVSEPYALRYDLPRHGGNVTLHTESGAVEFPVVGIYYDYVASQGTVSMSLDTYREHWQDEALTALAIRLAPGNDANAFARELGDALASQQRLFVRPNQALRDEAMVIFDRTFAITGALQLIAALVAFVGVLGAILSLQLEKQRELGILRAVGLTARQLWSLVMLETGLLGTVAGLLSMPTGLALSLVLVFIINRRSFGWTLQMHIESLPFLQALVLAVVAALLAGVYPALKMGKNVPAEAMRFE